MAVATAVRWRHVWERCAIAVIVEVDAVPDRGTELRGVQEDARYGPRRDVDYIVDGTPAVRKTGGVAGQEAKPLLAGHRGGRNAGVEAEKIRDGSHVVGAA